MASTAAAVASDSVSSAGHSVLRDDELGVPRALRLLAALVETEAIRYAAAASRPAESELLRSFRGGASARRTPTVSITEFLDRVQRFISLESVRHVIRLEGTSYVLAGIYLTRFMRSPAAREAGIMVEPTTAHRLVTVALFLGAKFGGPDDTLPSRWTFVFEVSSDGAIRAREIADLEERFLRAVDFRLFVDGEEFDWFCGVLELAPPAPSSSCSGSKRKAQDRVAGHSVLRDDELGVPRALRLLAALVETDAIRYAAAASRPAESDLLRSFRGGASARRTPTVSITEFLDRVQRFISLESVRHVIRLEGTSYVLAWIYLTRFMRSPAAREAGIMVEPTTAHRLVTVALFLGAKFGGPDDTLPSRWTFVFEVSSDGAIRAREIADLEERFLRAVDFRLFVDSEEFDWFCGVLERAPAAPSRSCSGSKRKAEVVEVEGEEEHRCVRPCLPPPAVVAN